MPPCKKKKKENVLKKTDCKQCYPTPTPRCPGTGVNLLTEPLSDTNDDNNNNDYRHQGENLDVYFSSL